MSIYVTNVLRRRERKDLNTPTRSLAHFYVTATFPNVPQNILGLEEMISASLSICKRLPCQRDSWQDR